MFRLGSILAVAFLPAFLTAVPAGAPLAAPVPPDGRPEFGADGLLTRADLEKVRFDSGPIKDKRRAEGEEKRAGVPDKFDVAVHMPWTKFREGEPIPAYFVIKNQRNTPLRLSSRIDFLHNIPTGYGGSAMFDIRDRATGKSVITSMCVSTNCGGGSVLDVTANGFSVQKADLNRVVDQPLAPGEYEVEWEYSPLVSAPVRFTVVKAEGKAAPLKPRPGVRFYQLVPPDRDPEEPPLLHECDLTPVSAGAMGAALAVGHAGAYVPDVREIPASDKLLTATAEWRPYRDGDRVVVTLHARPGVKAVRFDEVPQLYLQIETELDAEADRMAREAAKQGKDAAHEDRHTLLTPLTTQVRLPVGWREKHGVSERARVAVLVTSGAVEFPQGRGERLESVKELKRDAKANSAPVWTGVVRTEFTER